jgi:hypothetical protein
MLANAAMRFTNSDSGIMAIVHIESEVSYLKRCRRTSSANLHRIPRFGAWTNFYRDRCVNRAAPHRMRLAKRLPTMCVAQTFDVSRAWVRRLKEHRRELGHMIPGKAAVSRL